MILEQGLLKDRNNYDWEVEDAEKEVKVLGEKVSQRQKAMAQYK
jgi:hypothetical protein